MLTIFFRHSNLALRQQALTKRQARRNPPYRVATARREIGSDDESAGMGSGTPAGWHVMIPGFLGTSPRPEHDALGVISQKFREFSRFDEPFCDLIPR